MVGYPVPAAQAEVELRFKNSRFIGTAGMVETVEEARAFIGGVRQRFADASHHVYAFAVGYGGTVTHGMSDAGEPSGTAGRPALAVVKGADLGDVVVVISRYFGGTKLGTGGLVKAYTETTQAVLSEMPRQEKIHAVRFRVEMGYQAYAPCKKIIEEQGATVEEEEFSEAVELKGSIPDERLEELRKALQEATSGKVVAELIDSV